MLGRPLVLVALGLALGSSIQAASVVQEKVFQGPRMEIEPELHDFGSAAQNRKLTHDFVVKNVGSEDLVIRRISTSCGCTAALASQKVIRPGQQAKLEVTLETRKYRGSVNKSVSVASNDKRIVRTVRVKAFVEPGPRH